MARSLRLERDGHSSATPVARRLKQPTRMTGPDRTCGRSHASFLFGFAPGGVCRAASVAGNAVRSYRTVSPLPRLKRNAPRRSVLCGTVPGVAPAGRYPAPFVLEPGLSSPAAFRHWRGAAVQPTDVDRNGDMRGSRQGLSRDSLKKTVSGLSHTIALGDCGVGRVSINARNVSSVEGSAMPSTRACRKWRWNAVTTFCVASS